MKSSRLLLGILVILIFCAAAFAQTGSITGTVKDPTGASVAGATVTIASPFHKFGIPSPGRKQPDRSG